MNPYLEILLVVCSAVAAALVLCALIGGVWFVIQPTHEADRYELPIPSDREFAERDYYQGCNDPDQPSPSRSSVDCAPSGQDTDNQTAALAFKNAKLSRP